MVGVQARTRSVRRAWLAAAIIGTAVVASVITWQVRRAAAEGAPTVEPLWFAGTLTSGSGAPLTGTHSVAIGIYDTATVGTGTLLCGGLAGEFDLSASAGRFRVSLQPDAACVAAVQASGERWVEAVVDGTRLERRMKVGAVPYAIEATHAVQATHANDGIPVGMIAVFLQADPETSDGCPPGWERVPDLDGYTIRGGADPTAEGSDADSVSVNVPSVSTGNEARDFLFPATTHSEHAGGASYRWGAACEGPGGGGFLSMWMWGWSDTIPPRRDGELGFCNYHRHDTSPVTVSVPVVPKHKVALFCRFVGE